MTSACNETKEPSLYAWIPALGSRVIGRVGVILHYLIAWKQDRTDMVEAAQRFTKVFFKEDAWFPFDYQPTSYVSGLSINNSIWRESATMFFAGRLGGKGLLWSRDLGQRQSVVFFSPLFLCSGMNGLDSWGLLKFNGSNFDFSCSWVSWAEFTCCQIQQNLGLLVVKATIQRQLYRRGLWYAFRFSEAGGSEVHGYGPDKFCFHYRSSVF